MIQEIINNFNAYYSRLKFTCELKTDNVLPFLNLSLIKSQDGTIDTNCYKRNTYSGRYLNFITNHPLQQKIAIVKNLVNTS